MLRRVYANPLICCPQPCLPGVEEMGGGQSLVLLRKREGHTHSEKGTGPEKHGVKHAVERQCPYTMD